MIICPNCKSQCTPDHNFCPVCGAKMPQAASQTQQQGTYTPERNKQVIVIHKLLTNRLRPKRKAMFG